MKSDQITIYQIIIMVCQGKVIFASDHIQGHLIIGLQLEDKLLSLTLSDLECINLFFIPKL